MENYLETCSVSPVINRADCDLAGVIVKAIGIRSEHGAVEVVIISIESIMVGLIIPFP